MAAGTLVQGALFTVMVVRAGMLRDPEFGRELAAQVERSPRFFRNAPVVLDLKGAGGFAEAADFVEARDVLREQTLTLVGVQNAEPAQLAAATEAGLARFAPSATTPIRRAPRGAAAAPEPNPPETDSPPPAEPSSVSPPARAATRIVTEPVRSG